MNADHKQQHKVDLIIEEILNKSFTPKENKKGVRLCWLFCMEIVKELNGHLRNSPKGLSQIPKAKKWSVVLFNFKYDWHAGIVWPDGLHFIHYDEDKNKICCDRLSGFPWRFYIEGYYAW